MEKLAPNLGSPVSRPAWEALYESRGLQTIAPLDLGGQDRDSSGERRTADSVPGAIATKLLDAWYDANRHKLFDSTFRPVAGDSPGSAERAEDLSDELLRSIAAAWNAQHRTAGPVAFVSSGSTSVDSGSPAGLAQDASGGISARAGAAVRSTGASISQLFDSLAAKFAEDASAPEIGTSAPTGDGVRHGRIEPLALTAIGGKEPSPNTPDSGGGFAPEDFWSGGHDEILCHAGHAVHESDIYLKDPDPYDSATVYYKLVHYTGDAVIVPSIDWIATTDTQTIDIEMTQDLGKEYVKLRVLYDGVEYNNVRLLRVIAYEIDLDAGVADAQEATAPGRFLPLDPDELSVANLTPFTLDVSDSEIWTTSSIIQFNPQLEYEHVSLFAQVGDLVGSSGGSGGIGEAPDGYFNVAWDTPYTLGTTGTLLFYARGDSLSETSGDNTITVIGDAWNSPSGGTDSSRLTEPVSDTVVATVIKVDLDVDSNNDAGPTGGPDFSLAEEDIEEASPGKIIESWIGNDDDRDMIPDFADGYDFDNYDGTLDDYIYPCQSGFVPMTVTLPPGVVASTAKLKFTYSASDPDGVTTSPETVPHSGEPITLYSPAVGDLRIWKKDAGAARTTYHDYVEPNVWYTASEVTDLFVEGIDPGETTVTAILDPTGASGPLTDDTVKLTVVKLDIDVDSDNTAILDGSDLEDAIEDRDGSGVGQVGKRIFSNTDDDNQNGIAEYLDDNGDYETGETDNDLTKVLLKFEGIDNVAMAGYALWVGTTGKLNLWESDDKSPLTNSESVPPGSADEWYSWTIGGQNPPSSPIEIWAEGDDLDGADAAAEHIYWRLVKPGGTGYSDGDVIERDEVEVNVEKIVWPILQQKYGNWSERGTSDWNGIELKPAWYIDKALEHYINSPSERGLIRTIYPDKVLDGVPARSPLGDDELSSTVGPSEVGGTYPDGFVMEFDYFFERSRNLPTGYVQADAWKDGNLVKKLSFVGNSGVKFGAYQSTGKPVEAAILDVEKMVDWGGGLTQFEHHPAFHTGLQDNGDLVIPPNETEPLNTLMSGIVYGGDYRQMADWGDDVNLPDTWHEFYSILVNNKSRANGHMEIDVSRIDSTPYYIVDIYLDGSAVPCYSDCVHLTGAIGQLSLQSHWGSGVEFSDMSIIKKNP